jgi:drug/metabolite transporter (DMT)-like permease
MVYLGLFPTAVAFLLWAYALAHTTAGRLAASSYLVPALAVLMSWLALDEVPVPAALLGGTLCLLGVAVTRAGGRRPPVPPASLVLVQAPVGGTGQAGGAAPGTQCDG